MQLGLLVKAALGLLFTVPVPVAQRTELAQLVPNNALHAAGSTGAVTPSKFSTQGVPAGAGFVERVIIGVWLTVTVTVLTFVQPNPSVVVSVYVLTPAGIPLTVKLTLALLAPDTTGAPIAPGPVRVCEYEPIPPVAVAVITEVAGEQRFVLGVAVIVLCCGELTLTTTSAVVAEPPPGFVQVTVQT